MRREQPEAVPQAKTKGNRPPPGMTRSSIYASDEAFAAFNAAVEKILEALGDGTPRHIAASALLQAGAGQVDDVSRELVKQRRAELAERLAALQDHPETDQP
ncbi:hypothetical protein [Amycolatopsis minnesotensis]|uniref:Uncharacterized protein n=1 Tax=Amycolatopsis minnesotensis TaxID=337894 RepID=A0ABP5DNZ9_9PSEU